MNRTWQNGLKETAVVVLIAYPLLTVRAPRSETGGAAQEMFAGADGLEVARPAPRRPLRVPFPVWMALARANADPPADDEAQGLLGG